MRVLDKLSKSYRNTLSSRSYHLAGSDNEGPALFAHLSGNG